MKYVDNIDKEIESVAGKMVKGKKSSKKTMVDSGHGYKVAKWTRRASPKKALPLSKSVKKGSPRSYENLKKAKPLGRKRKNGIG